MKEVEEKVSLKQNVQKGHESGLHRVTKRCLFYMALRNRKSPRRKLQGNIFSPVKAGNVFPATECVRQSPAYHLAQL